MKTKKWILWKRTGNYADALAAVGLGQFIYLLTGQAPRLKEKGSAFVVTVDEEVDLEELDYVVLQDDPGYTYIRLKDDDDKAPYRARSYEEGRKKLLQYREIRAKYKSLRDLSAEERQRLEEMKPDSDWYLIQCLRVIQAFGPYNNLHYEIRNADQQVFIKSVKLKLEALALGKQLTEISTPFKSKISAVQAFNPSVGKGINRPKPDSVSLASLPTNYIDWFEEWLHFLGVEHALHAYILGDDFKFICIVPGNSHLSTIRNNMISKLRDIPNPPRHSIQIDILSSMKLAQFILRYHEHEVIGRSPRDVIKGIQTAYFKSLGTSRALTNQSFIGLPGWFPIQKNEDVTDWLDLLEDHEKIIRSLNEEHSEEMLLLQHYRNFISANDPQSLFKFFAGNGMNYLRMKERGKYAVLPSREHLRRLVMKGYTSYYSLLENEGFREVAKAMRQATVTEQYYKSIGQQVFEIHYDLFQKIKQHARFPDKLLAVILEFVNEFNRENARRKEQLAKNNHKGRTRSSVTTEGIEKFMQAFEAFSKNSESFAMLLIAYASATDKKQSVEEPIDQQVDEVNGDILVEDEE